jgi:hypothetical protein
VLFHFIGLKSFASYRYFWPTRITNEPLLVSPMAHANPFSYNQERVLLLRKRLEIHNPLAVENDPLAY